MPIYGYFCEDGHETEELRSVSSRHDPIDCVECKKPATLRVTTVGFDTLHMGVDPAFPSAWDKWEKMQVSKNTGKQWDSNNRRYGGDWEKQKSTITVGGGKTK